MPNMEVVTVVKIIVNEVISKFGIPDNIHSDQGRQLEKVISGNVQNTENRKDKDNPVSSPIGQNG